MRHKKQRKRRRQSREINNRCRGWVLLVAFFCWMTCAISWTGGCGGSASNNGASSNAPQQGVVYYIDDHLGSTTLVTDSNGNVLREEARYPYGLDRKIDNPGSVDAHYVYTGKELDEETGLVYFGGRYYAPEMGRWISPDPLLVDTPSKLMDNYQEENIYAYVQNNPVNNIDKEGLWTVGYNVDFTGGMAGGARGGLAYVHDDKGNIGILSHWGGGGYGGIGGGIQGGLQITKEKTIFDLEGKTLSTGFSAGEIIGGGAEMISAEGKISGIEVGAGLNIPSPAPLETHGVVEENKLIFSINPTEKTEEIFDTYKDTVRNYFKEAFEPKPSSEPIHQGGGDWPAQYIQ